MAVYSIWLMPEKRIALRLKELIEKMALDHGGPVFNPHMTLLGDITGNEEELIQTLELFHEFERPIYAEVQCITFSTTYFQDVFIKIKENEALMSLNIKIKEAMEQPNDFYVPHVSLLYGDHNLKLRESLSKSIELGYHEMTFDRMVLAKVGKNVNEFEELFEKAAK